MAIAIESEPVEVIGLLHVGVVQIGKCLTCHLMNQRFCHLIDFSSLDLDRDDEDNRDRYHLQTFIAFSFELDSFDFY